MTWRCVKDTAQAAGVPLYTQPEDLPTDQRMEGPSDELSAGDHTSKTKLFN